MPVLESPNCRAPEFVEGTWLNSPPLRMRDLRGRVVLVDFWDYTCVNCLRTLPALRRWHERYAGLGLTQIGIHAPEFAFAHATETVADAVTRLGLHYPILLDNHFRHWQAYANRAWPTQYLIDPQGYIRYRAVGEGHDRDTEEAIQQLLGPSAIRFPLPPPVPPPVEPAVCVRTTPELYLGYGRGQIANPEGLPPDLPIHYPPGAPPVGDLVALGGPWIARKDCLESASTPITPAQLSFQYDAAEVNAVLHPPEDASGLLFFHHDPPLAASEEWGGDVCLDGQLPASLRTDCPRLYNLLRRNRFSSATLMIEFTVPGLRIYTFAFGGRCS